jgi:hypothetical protein
MASMCRVQHPCARHSSPTMRITAISPHVNRAARGGGSGPDATRRRRRSMLACLSGDRCRLRAEARGALEGPARGFGRVSGRCSWRVSLRVRAASSRASTSFSVSTPQGTRSPPRGPGRSHREDIAESQEQREKRPCLAGPGERCPQTWGAFDVGMGGAPG